MCRQPPPGIFTGASRHHGALDEGLPETLRTSHQYGTERRTGVNNSSLDTPAQYIYIYMHIYI